MKKRLLIICSIIGVLLVGFQFPIYAEETTPDYSSSTSIMSSTPLDKYFYDNYNLLPYIESNGTQYINTNVYASNNLLLKAKFSNYNLNSSNVNYLFGVAFSDRLFFGYSETSNSVSAGFGENLERFADLNIPYYSINNISFDKNDLSFNEFNYSFPEQEFTSSYPIYIFATNSSGNANNYSNYRLYNLSIYDYSANEGEGALVRDYYPARSKSGDVIGLYDAVTKTFVTTSGSVPFASPTGDPVNLSLGANITQFLSGSLSWIGAIFEGINEMPIIWVFIAIGLAGVAFRWARRIVHF